jgi:DNA-binding response OmpR family regulator/signal transduction histidine kinase
MQTPSIVLMIDDEPSALAALKALLEGEGYRLECASSSVDGLRMAFDLQPDLILLDVMMPGMDGLEVCRRLRANPQLAEVPIVMVTALDDQASRLQGIEAGADDFISKPYNKAELRARVRTITRLNRHRRLHIEHERFSWMLQQAQDGYLILSEDDTITYANPRAHLYLGDPTEEGLLKNKFLEIAKRQYRLYPGDAWESWPEPAEIPRYLVEPETPTAQAFWLRVDLLPSTDTHTFGRFIQLCDVTEQITTHRDMRTFHSVVEHKLRTPLGHVQMFLDLIQGRIAKHQFDDLANLAQNANEGARLLVDELNEVFNYISAPTLAQPGEGFHLIKFRTRLDTLCADLDIKKLNITIPSTLLKERLSLTQSALDLVLWEVLENARKFHPQHDPKIDVTVAACDDRLIRIQIQDDGIALSPKQLLWAWMPYMQGEKYLTGQVPGMGLGLPLVRTLVWQTGGNVRLANRTAHSGVVVELILPLASQEKN